MVQPAQSTASNKGEQKPPLEVTFRGTKLEVSQLLPLPAGIWRNQLRAAGLDILRLGKLVQNDGLEIEHLYTITKQVLARAGFAELTDEHLDSELTFRDIRMIAMAAVEAEGDNAPQSLNRPTSTGSSSSPNGGDGAQQTSTG